MIADDNRYSNRVLLRAFGDKNSRERTGEVSWLSSFVEFTLERSEGLRMTGFLSKRLLLL